MSTEFPTSSPGEVPFAPLAQLAERYIDHAARLVDHRHGCGEPLAHAAVVEHALAALAYQRRLADEALAGRGLIVAEALTHGATVERVAAAVGLDVDQLRTELVRWAEGGVRAGYLTAADRDELLRLVQR